MGRLIALLGLIIGAIVLFRRVFGSSLPHIADKIKAAKAKPAKPQSDTLDEPMLKCKQCGVHSPKSKSVSEGNDFFCSTEHKSQFLSNTKKENTS